MSIRDDFFAAQAKASLWDVAVSIKRGNPLPLDANSVFKAYGTVGGADYAGSLLEYVTDNPVAYPGQICAVVGADATTIYYLDQNLAIQPVGIIPTGDGKSIDVAETGEISLHGFGDLTASHVGYLPRVKKVIDIAAAEGVEEVYHLEIEWAPVSAIVEGDGNSVTEVAAGCPCINVEDKAEEGFEGHKYEISLNLSAEEGNILEEKEDGLYAKVDVPAYAIKKDERAEDATETTYHLTKDGTNVDVAIVVPDAYNDEALADRVDALEGKVDTGDQKVSVYVAEQISAATIGKLTKVIADSVTEDGKVVIGGETTDPAEHVIYMVKVETATGDMYKEYQVIGGELVQTGDTSTDLSNYVTKDTTVNGAALSGNIKLYAKDILIWDEDGQDDNSRKSIEAVLSGKMDAGATGSDIKLYKNTEGAEGTITAPTIAEAIEAKADKTQVASDIATAKQEAIDAAAAAEEAKGYAVASDVEENYAKKATDLAGYGINDAYTKDQIDEKIGTPGVPKVPAQGEPGQEGYIPEVPAKDGTGIFASTYSKAEINALLDEVEGGSTESAASVARQLDEYKTTNNQRVKDIEDKVDNARAKADEAWNKADKAANDLTELVTNGQVAINKQNIKNLQDLVGSSSDFADKKEGTLAYRIGALEAHDQAHATEFSTLSGTVGQNTKDIAQNKSDITTINTTKIPALQQAIEDEESARIAAIGAPSKPAEGIEGEEGYIPAEKATGVYAAIEAVAGTIDFSPYAKKDDVDKTYAKKDDVANTYATIAALESIYKAGNEELGTKDDGLLAIAIRDIKQNAADIAKLVGADENKTARKIAQEEIAAQLATAPEAFDTLLEMATWLGTHSTDAVKMDNRIKANEDKLAGFGGEGQPAVVKTYIDESIAAIKPYELPVATAEKLGGIKSAADVDGVAVANAVYVANDGKASVKAISTDVLVNGEAELVLNGGNAAGVTA